MSKSKRASARHNVFTHSYSSVGDDVAKKIYSFAFLPHGWDFGMGDPIKDEVIERALEIHELGLCVGLLTDATPEVDGGITITFFYRDDSVDVRVTPDSKYDVTYERGTGPVFEELAHEEGVDRTAVEKYLRQLRNNMRAQYKCRSYAGSELIGTVSRRSGSNIARSLITTPVGYLLSTVNASTVQGQFART